MAFDVKARYSRRNDNSRDSHYLVFLFTIILSKFLCDVEVSLYIGVTVKKKLNLRICYVRPNTLN